MTNTTALWFTALALGSTFACASERGSAAIIQPTITLVHATPSVRAGELDQARGRVRLCDDEQQCSTATLPAQVGKVDTILSHEFIKSDKTSGSFVTFGKKWVSMCYVAAHDATVTCAPLTQTKRLRGFTIAMATPLPARKGYRPQSAPVLFTPPAGSKPTDADYTAAARAMMQGIYRTGKALAIHANDHYLGRLPLASLTARASSTGCESNQRIGMICSNGSGAIGRNSLIDDSGEGYGWGGSGGADGGDTWPGGTDPQGTPGPDDGGTPAPEQAPDAPPAEIPANLPKVIITGTREPGNDGPQVDIPFDMLPWNGEMCIRIGPGPMVCQSPPPITIDPDHIVTVPGKRAEVPLKQIAVSAFSRIIHMAIDWVPHRRPKAASGDYGPVYEEAARKCDAERQAKDDTAWELYNHGWSDRETREGALQRNSWEYADCLGRARKAQRDANAANGDDDGYDPIRTPVTANK